MARKQQEEHQVVQRPHSLLKGSLPGLQLLSVSCTDSSALKSSWDAVFVGLVDLKI